MQLLTAVVFALIALTTADVSHLTRTYLPPSRTTTFSTLNGYSTGSSSLSGIHKDRLLAAPVLAKPLIQHTYVSPQLRTHQAQNPTLTSHASLIDHATSNIKPVASLVTSPLIQKSYTAPVTTHTTYGAPVLSTSHSSGHKLHSDPNLGSHAALIKQSYTTTIDHGAPVLPSLPALIAHKSIAAPSLGDYKAHALPLKSSLVASRYLEPAISTAHGISAYKTSAAPVLGDHKTHAVPITSSPHGAISSLKTYSPALEHYKTQFVPAVQHYGAPAISTIYTSPAGKYSAPSVSLKHNHVAPVVETSLAEKYSTPTLAHPHHHGVHIVQSSLAGKSSVPSAAFGHHHVGPRVETLPSHTSSADKYSAPSVAFSLHHGAPVLENLTKIQHTYSAPALTHQKSLITKSPLSGIETKYASNGGYVY